MKAITLWQPWASLVALGVKTIETRSWSTSYRGPLAIHAAKKMPASWTRVGDYQVQVFGRNGLALRGPGLPEFRSTPRLEGYLLPLGAVVATCTLVDVMPIIAPEDCCWHHEHPRGVGPVAHAAIDGQVIFHRPDDPRYHTTVLCEQAYGDYTPGRFAWLLEDVEPVDPPVPARGRQQLWEWSA